MNDLIPLLPEIKFSDDSEDHFILRRLYQVEHEHIETLEVGDLLEVTKQMMAFYLGGCGVRGVPGTGIAELICEPNCGLKYLGNLSLVPSENEILLTSEYKFKIIGKFRNITALLDSGILKREKTIASFENRQGDMLDDWVKAFVVVEIVHEYEKRK